MKFYQGNFKEKIVDAAISIIKIVILAFLFKLYVDFIGIDIQS